MFGQWTMRYFPRCPTTLTAVFYKSYPTCPNSITLCQISKCSTWAAVSRPLCSVSPSALSIVFKLAIDVAQSSESRIGSSLVVPISNPHFICPIDLAQEAAFSAVPWPFVLRPVVLTSFSPSTVNWYWIRKSFSTQSQFIQRPTKIHLLCCQKPASLFRTMLFRGLCNSHCLCHRFWGESYMFLPSLCWSLI